MSIRNLLLMLFLSIGYVAAGDTINNQQLSQSELGSLFNELGISIYLEPIVMAEVRHPLDDFILIDAVLEGGGYVNFYVGNHPNLPGPPSQDVEVVEWEQNQVLVYGFLWDSDLGNSGSVLADFSDTIGYPQYLHVFYDDLEDPSTESVMQIVKSISSLSEN